MRLYIACVDSQRQPTTVDEDRFGARLRYERERRNWTQAYVADRLAQEGVKLHATAIAKMEYRDTDRPRAIRLDEAAALARVFGLSLQEMTTSPEVQFYEIEFAARKLRMLSEQVEEAASQFMDKLHQLGDFRKLNTSDAKYVRDVLADLEREALSAHESYVHSLSCLQDVQWLHTDAEVVSAEDTSSIDADTTHHHVSRLIDAYVVNLMEESPDNKLDSDEVVTVSQHTNECSSCLNELLFERAANRGYNSKEVLQTHLEMLYRLEEKRTGPEGDQR